MENAINKIYEEISKTGVVSDNQLALIILYEKLYHKKNKKSDIDKLFDFGNKAINFLNKNFPKEWINNAKL